MQFFNPSAFVFLVLIPIAALIFGFRHWIKSRSLGKFADLEMIPKLAPFSSSKRPAFKAALIIMAVLLCVLALARPQWGEEKRQVQRKGVDIVFLFDTSLSMLTQDTKPSRFDKAKIEIRNVLKKLKGDRIALVAFSGSAFLQAPLTIDYGAFLLFLDAIKVGYVPDPGSSLTDAIRTGLGAFPKGDNKYKVMMIFSDGEETTSQATEVIQKAKAAKVRIYCIGFGTKQGAPIPLTSGRGGQVSGFKKDRLGKVVISKLDDELLEKIARETGGLYFPSTPSEKEMDLIYTHIQGLGKKTFKAQDVIEKEEHYQIFLFPALILLMLELLISDRKKTGIAS
ncbi:MAG: VWA domain-containing protein [Candidatus Omnitrophica bacterium]|nr:VWA domain-containing protein [Candidatus Omnitrophota bacterium]